MLAQIHDPLQTFMVLLYGNNAGNIDLISYVMGKLIHDMNIHVYQYKPITAIEFLMQM